MAEYIEREALEIYLNHRLNFLMAENGEYDHYTSGFDDAVTIVEDFPSADVSPVVRCKDCKYYCRKDMPKGTGWCTAVDVSSFDKHFCSYGEKREEKL